MSLPAGAAARIEAATGAAVHRTTRLYGGNIAQTWRADLAHGRALVVKSGAKLDLEGWMLRYLAKRTRLPVPAVHHAEPDLLVMDFVRHDEQLDAAAEAHLADLVAELHAIEGPHFGFERDTLIGSLPQPNPPAADWLAFFRDHRLLHMARTGLEARRLPPRLMGRIEALAGKLDRWIARDAKPALIHGDLWGGNILAYRSRIAALIDPALYFADPEIELAFMTLFGSVGDAFFARYGERARLRPGFFEERRDLYNLYPLLVHVRLFGGSYVQQVERVLARYGC